MLHWESKKCPLILTVYSLVDNNTTLSPKPTTSLDVIPCPSIPSTDRTQQASWFGAIKELG